VPRIRKYLAQEFRLDEAAVQRWVAHWSLAALQAVEAHLAHERETARYCHGEAPTLADVCVCSQVIAARDYGRCDLASVPAAARIYGECMKLEAFARAHPSRQQGAPADLRG
jgi:glutathione S-transferase